MTGDKGRVLLAIDAAGRTPEQKAPAKHHTEPAYAGPADRTGMRVATAARKKLAKKQRGSGAKSRGATPARGGKPRAPRATGLRRAQPAAKKRGTKRANKPATKRVVVSAAKKRTAAKRVATPAARKRVRAAVPKPAVRKRVAKPSAKRAGRKPAVRAVAKSRRVPMPVTRKPVARRTAAPVPPAFAAQRATADARGLLLFELARARAAVKAAIQGLTGANALQPTAPGKWSSFEIVLHLSERDRVRLDEFDRTLAGEPRTWAGMHDPEMGPVNESHLAPLRAHTWDEAVRRMDSLRDELLQRLGRVPSEPDHVWKAGHAFGDMMWGLPEHDRHHAMQIKHARIGGTSPREA